MTFSRYADLNQKMTEHFQNGDFQQALELIEREGTAFPENRPLVDYWKMCAAARVDDRARVFQVAENYHKDGLWYGEMMWRMTPSFKALQGDAEFERLVSISLGIQEKDNADNPPTGIKIFPKNMKKETPLLIALHGNQSTALASLPFWRGVVDPGFALAVPQSVQAMFTGAYIWDNLEIAFEQVKQTYEEMKNEMDFDPDRVVLAGHSMGAAIAIQMALTGEIPVHRLVVIGPALPFEDTPEELAKFLPAASERGLRAGFIVGEKDVDVDGIAIQKFIDKLRSAGISCEHLIKPGATHDSALAYGSALLNELAFVCTSQ